MHKNQAGFVVIVTMLVMAALLGLGLSVPNQSTQDAAESGNESESVRVFNAAEAGIEEILADPSNFSGATGDLTDLNDFDGSAIRYRVMPNDSLQTYLLQGGTATIDLPGGANGATIFQWDTDADCNDAALLIALYYDDGSPKVKYEGVNPACDTDKVAGFAEAISASSPYRNKHIITIPSTELKMIRIKSLLAATNLAVTGGFDDPQYHTVRSEATGPDGVTRTIEVAKTIEVPPAILDYAVYSGASITKN